MKHDDFKTLDVTNVLTTVLQYCRDQSQAKAVHWLSTYAMERVHDTAEHWEWAFSTADIIGKHLVSVPGGELKKLFDFWKLVDKAYPQPWNPPFKCHALENSSVLPLTHNNELQGFLLFEGMPQKALLAWSKKAAAELEIGAKYVAFCYQMLDAANMSYIDEVTGLYNQRYLPLVLEHEIMRAQRDKTAFSLMFLDIDYFKMVNDGRGHWVGSRLLTELAKILKSQVRSCDYSFRYGGDEFIVLLGNSAGENARGVAERIRKSIENHPFTVEGHSLNLTVSIGLASYPEHADTASGLIQIADQAMYYGKRKSRNIVFVAS